MRNAAHNTEKTVEDYLEAILMIKDQQGYVRSVDVADHLGVTKPSVSYATKRLRGEGYLTTDHAGMLVLTESGMEIARRTYRRHTLLTEFFTLLGVSPEQARTDACQIEHDISEETFEALCRHVEQHKSELASDEEK
ncbi:MAG: metal-dependent transcriptional regulator [Anaerovoracaceae bacterium]